jgi:hypothetical protein
MATILPSASALVAGMSNVDITTFNEVTAISLAVLGAANNNLYQTTVAGGTTMTNTTINPYLVFNANLITNSLTIPNHGYSTGDSIQFTTTNQLPSPLSAGFMYFVIVVNANSIQVATTQSNAYANVAITLTTIGLGVNQVQKYAAAQLYFQVWMGLITNLTYQNQINAVTGYFSGLGYIITQATNPATNTTFMWQLQWSS